MLKDLVIAAAVSAVTLAAHASSDNHVKEPVELKDKTIIHVFIRSPTPDSPPR